jgi:uncharacterized membrane protein
MVFVDTIVPYLWMGILIFCAGSQARFDKWNQVDEKIITDLRENAVPAVQSKTGARPGAVAIVVFMAAIGAVVSRFVAGFLPVVEGVVTFATWQIIAASGLGIALSFTPVKKIEDHGASKVGYYFLYLVLAAIGARSYIDRTGTVLVLVAGGCMIVAVHAFVLYIAARLLKAPLFLVAAASQANIGGVASAPVVAAVYQPGLASVGLLLAVSGNIMGTYLGVITSHLCRAIAG